MKLHELKNTVPRQNRKRVGRGDGSGHGRTAGRGEKGAGARTGHSRRPYFEGGQIPLIRRLPKRGFKNPNHTEFVVVNLNILEELDAGDAVIDRAFLQEKGHIGKTNKPLKILGDGELTKKINVVADKFSKSAREKIEGLGGTCKETAAAEAPAEA
jgi:large subunit ribosomal protein L15